MKKMKQFFIAFILITGFALAQDPQRKLMESICSGNIEAVEYWISQGANINKKYDGPYSINGIETQTTKYNEWPVHAALGALNADMVIFLLDKGADPDKENGFGSSLIQVLATKSHHFVAANNLCEGQEHNRDIKMAKKMIEKKADLNGKAFGKRTLQIAREYDKYRPTEAQGALFSFLKSNGAKE
ncbi:MAG: hypothetical protein IPM51_00695 [Sphingobacteriaceae bacterium]|nr:hypothetical protein [Sphingobacteriaceae bacterium]